MKHLFTSEMRQQLAASRALATVTVQNVEDAKPLADALLAGGTPANSACCSAQPSNRPEIPDELAEVIDAWPDLPDAVRAGILAMVRAAT